MVRTRIALVLAAAMTASTATLAWLQRSTLEGPPEEQKAAKAETAILAASDFGWTDDMKARPAPPKLDLVGIDVGEESEPNDNDRDGRSVVRWHADRPDVLPASTPQGL